MPEVTDVTVRCCTTIKVCIQGERVERDPVLSITLWIMSVGMAMKAEVDSLSSKRFTAKEVEMVSLLLGISVGLTLTVCRSSFICSDQSLGNSPNEPSQLGAWTDHGL